MMVCRFGPRGPAKSVINFVVFPILASFAIVIDSSNSSSNFNSSDFTNSTFSSRFVNLDNELWSGLIRDCSRKLSFSCIQKNAYDYLDRTFIEADSNYTVFDGFVLKRNHDVCYDDCVRDNLIESRIGNSHNYNGILDEESEGARVEHEEDKLQKEQMDPDDFEHQKTPLQEITDALSKKAMKFLATRNYELRLPEFVANGAKIRISPKEIDERGALIRLDFGDDPKELRDSEQGRIFKFIIKKIKSKLLVAFFALILIIKLIKVKFMFVIPFLFGVGVAKKLFLKLVLFFVPAFAHVFKLCSSYYSTYATKYHHHHHQIAHHHHHVPVPFPIYHSKPWSHDSSHSSSKPFSSFWNSLASQAAIHSAPPTTASPPPFAFEEFTGYDYAHPHIQYRKDMDELKEWGIEPYEEPYDVVAPQLGVIHPGSKQGQNSKFAQGPYGMPPQYAANAKPIGATGYVDKPPFVVSAQSVGYNGFPARRSPGGQAPGKYPTIVLPSNYKSAEYFLDKYNKVKKRPQQQNQKPPEHTNQQPAVNEELSPYQQKSTEPSASQDQTTRKPYDDEVYGPIMERLDDIFGQLRFLDESCRERLVCSMYKNPALYSPNSNLVSSELSRDVQELQHGNTASSSGKRFYRYQDAARLGQDGGDCLRTYHCHINTE